MISFFFLLFWNYASDKLWQLLILLEWPIPRWEVVKGFFKAQLLDYVIFYWKINDWKKTNSVIGIITTRHLIQLWIVLWERSVGSCSLMFVFSTHSLILECRGYGCNVIFYTRNCEIVQQIWFSNLKVGKVCSEQYLISGKNLIVDTIFIVLSSRSVSLFAYICSLSLLIVYHNALGLSCNAIFYPRY